MRLKALLFILVSEAMFANGLAFGIIACTSLIRGTAFAPHALGNSALLKWGLASQRGSFGVVGRSLCIKMTEGEEEPPKRKIKLGSRSKNPKAAREAEKAAAAAAKAAARPRPKPVVTSWAAPGPGGVWGPEHKQKGDTASVPPNTKPADPNLARAVARESDRDGEEGSSEDAMSNRAKFRQTPINPAVLAKIKEIQVCSTMSQAMRAAARDAANRDQMEREKTFRGFSRPPMYRDNDPHIVNFIGQSKKDKLAFIAGALQEESFPPEGLPEVCFAGRSNVGKSSLINAVTLSTVVRSSDKPGMTQEFNFYQLPKRLMLIDLPGYGFAFANAHKMEGWKILMDRLLTSRKALKRVFVIIDARHGLKVNDKEFLNRLEQSRVNFQVIMTKCDLVTPDDLARRHTIVLEELNNYSKALKTIRLISAYTGAGLSELAQDLYSLSVKPTILRVDDPEDVHN